MRKLLLIPFLLFSTICFAAAPNRTYNYVSHAVIDPNQNNTNENNLYSYLQNGVDTYSAGSITDVAISAGAAIAYIKLNLLNSIQGTDISSFAAIPYSTLSLTGSIINADIASGAGILGSKLDLSTPGNIGSTSPGTGAFTTLKVGATNQGDILYDNGTSFVRLTPGTSGQFLKTQGSSANPLWANSSNIQIFNSSGTFVAPPGCTKILVSMVGAGSGGWSNDTTTSGGPGGGGGASLVNYPYTVIPGNSYTVTVGVHGSGGVYASGGVAGGNGGSSSFDGTISVNGGKAGVNISTGGVGGTSTSANSLNASLTNGGGVLPAIASNVGGNGAAPAANNGGGGGGTIWGMGGNGGIATNGNSPLANNGGGGGGSGKNASGLNGSDGSDGCVVIIN